MDDYFFLGNPVLSSTKYLSSQWNPYAEQTLGVVDRQATVSYYRPMAHIVLDYCYAVFKDSFWKYHLLNLFLFSFAASLFYLLIVKLSGNTSLAFLASLFYLIHPINGIVVNYISASVFALEVIFIFGTILLLWESLERKNNRPLYFLSLLVSFLSLFWHESGIMIPFYVSAVIILFRDESFKKKAVCLFPYFLIIFIYLIFRAHFLGAHEDVLRTFAQYHMTEWEHLATFFMLLIWYVIRLFYPQGIVMQWAMPVLNQHILMVNLDAALSLLLFCLLYIRFAKEKICKLALIFLLIGFAPAYFAAFRSPQAGAIIEPHWFIFSCVGFFILLAHTFIVILRLRKQFALVLLFLVIFAWDVASHAYNQIWKDQKTYALYWSQKAPTFKMSYYFIAYSYQLEGDFMNARKYYGLALMGDTSDVNIYNNLGIMDSREGKWKPAVSNYNKALSINPFLASSYCNLGYSYYLQGHFKEAKTYLSRSLILNPLLSQARLNLARIFLKDSEYQKAIDLCRQNIDLVNDDTETLFFLVDIYIKKKDPDSVKKYALAIINSKDDAVTLTRLGGAMGENGFNDIALDSFIKAIRIAPGYTEAYLNAGILFGNMGKYEEAIHIWRLGLRVNPYDHRLNANIVKAEGLIKGQANSKG